MKRTTLRDVSDAAQVSTYTVSVALRSGDGISRQTRDHVRRVANELGYVPNEFARGLRGGRTNAVGILAANSLNPFYALLVAHAEVVLRGAGYHGFVMDAVLDGEYRGDREDDFVDELLRRQVGGVVLTHAISPRNLSRLRDATIPIVLVDVEGRLEGGAARVTADSELGGRLVAEHFAAHKSPGPWVYVAFPADYSTRASRERGFITAATTAGVAVDIVESRNDAESARQAVLGYFNELGLDGAPATRPGAIFASNELLLQGVLVALRERSLSVPDQVAVIGYDDFSWATLLDPPVTVIDQHVAELGTAAADRLLAEMEGGVSRTSVDVVLRPHLIVRRSCGCLHPA